VHSGIRKYIPVKT